MTARMSSDFNLALFLLAAGKIFRMRTLEVGLIIWNCGAYMVVILRFWKRRVSLTHNLLGGDEAGATLINGERI